MLLVRPNLYQSVYFTGQLKSLDILIIVLPRSVFRLMLEVITELQLELDVIFFSAPFIFIDNMASGCVCFKRKMCYMM